MERDTKNERELYRLAAMLEDEVCDLRILADDGVAGHHKRILGRSAAMIESIAHTIKAVLAENRGPQSVR